MNDLSEKVSLAFDKLLDDPWGSPVANDVTAGLRKRYVNLYMALHNLEGQVIQARDGFGIWTYSNSNSMKQTLEEVKLALTQAVQ